jgi:YHS domain-containing protein
MPRVSTVIALLLPLSLLFAAVPAAAAPPAADPPAPRVNIDKDGVALQGYDPVAFFTDGRPAKGEPAITAAHQGATYRFARPENRELFLKDPGKYVPAYGGFCAYGVGRGYFVKVEIDTWQIVDGRLLLNYDKDVAKKFNSDQAGNIRRADEVWKELLTREGR